MKIIKLYHKNDVGYGDCNGLLLYYSKWSHDGVEIPFKHKMICKKCKEAVIVNSEDIGLTYQLKLI